MNPEQGLQKCERKKKKKKKGLIYRRDRENELVNSKIFIIHISGFKWRGNISFQITF